MAACIAAVVDPHNGKPMDGQCPKCGGSNLRQITPGFFECISLVVVGIIHRPDGAGPMPAQHACRHRFQVGVNTVVELCQCGRQSIGRCADCTRPLCGIHGTASGIFLCRNCVDRRDQQCRDQERTDIELREAASALESAEAERRRILVTAKMALARGPGEIVALIIQNDADIPDETCRAAWLQLVRSKEIKPTHDIVTAVGRRHLLYQPRDPGTGWREVGRTDAWCAPGSMLGEGEHSNRWLDSEGAMWANASSQDLHLYPDWTPQSYPFRREARGEPNWIALPKRQAFHVSVRPGQEEWSPRNKQSPWLYVVGGIRLSRRPADNEFTKVAAAILRAR
jgi:hypothetical protein